MKPSFGSMVRRLIWIQVLINIFANVVMLVLFISISPNFEWIPNLIFIMVILSYVWSITTFYGNKDQQIDEIQNRDHPEINTVTFRQRNGFLAGLYSISPLLLINLLAFIPSFKAWTQPILQIWFVAWSFLFKRLDAWYPWEFFLFAGVFILFSGLGYLNGKAYRKRMQSMVQRKAARIKQTHN